MKTHKWSDVRKKLPAKTLAEIDRSVEAELVEMSLADLRRELGFTQVDMAEAAEMTQGMLSRVERQEDHLVSTLRRWVRALGGDLEITAVVGAKRVKLSL